MNLVTITSRHGRSIAGFALLLLAPLASVSEAAVVAADTFTRADSTTLGSTEVGSFAWNERLTTGASANVAEILSGELLFETGSSDLAIVNVGLTDLIVSADVHFVGDTTGSGTTKSIGMVFRGSNMDSHMTSDAGNQGLATIQFTNSGGLLIGENKAAGFAYGYNNNPFKPSLGDSQPYGNPGDLPATYNGLPFDADGDGRLQGDEPFQIGAVLSGTSLDVKINGLTIQTFTLTNTGGLTGNYFALIKNNLGGGGNSPTGAFDNLTISNIPEPSTFTLLAISLVAFAGRRRRS